MKKNILVLLLFTVSTLWSQKYKFGKVSIDELKEKTYSNDSDASAAILFSGRKTTFEYSEDTGFYINTEYYKRIKIYTKEGFNKASLKRYLYYDVATTREEMLFIKAVTYNLENGKIIKTKLKNSDIFFERLNQYYFTKKFTMPNLKEGCIIEWKYTIKTPFITRLGEVKVQEDIPVKKHKTKIYIPEFFVYNTLTKGYLAIAVDKDERDRTISFSVHQNHENTLLKTTKTESVSTTIKETSYTIEMSDIPALSDEPYSGNIDNYRAGLIFELSHTILPLTPHNYASSWEAVTNNIYNSSSFGDQLKKSKHFIEDLPAIINGKLSEIEKMYAVFNFVKTKIKWNKIQGFYTDLGTKKAYKEGLGNTADINLNLTAMLREAGLNANPVLISTTNNGIPLFPTRVGFNYVISLVKIGENNFLLDATGKLYAPNLLPEKTLNFRGRAIYPDGNSKWIDLYNQKHSIKKTAVNVRFNGEGFQGNARTIYTNRYALQYREKVLSKNKEELIEWIDENLTEIEILNARVSNLENLNKDVIETIKFQSESFNEEIGDKIYIDPYLYLQMSDNPFKSLKREFPVFYNTPWAHVSIIKLTIPDNYSIVSVPQDIEYLFLDDLGHYKNTITQQGSLLTITSTFVINKPVISSVNYNNLKDFYQKIITKQAEKIILTKN